MILALRSSLSCCTTTQQQQNNERTKEAFQKGQQRQSQRERAKGIIIKDTATASAAIVSFRDDHGPLAFKNHPFPAQTTMTTGDRRRETKRTEHADEAYSRHRGI